MPRIYFFWGGEKERESARACEWASESGVSEMVLKRASAVGSCITSVLVQHDQRKIPLHHFTIGIQKPGMTSFSTQKKTSSQTLSWEPLLMVFQKLRCLSLILDSLPNKLSETMRQNTVPPSLIDANLRLIHRTVTELVLSVLCMINSWNCKKINSWSCKKVSFPMSL